MAKRAAIGVRFHPEEEDALRRAAKGDARPMAAMAHKATVEWLRERGWLDAGADASGIAGAMPMTGARMKEGKDDA